MRVTVAIVNPPSSEREIDSDTDESSGIGSLGEDPDPYDADVRESDEENVENPIPEPARGPARSGPIPGQAHEALGGNPVALPPGFNPGQGH